MFGKVKNPCSKEKLVRRDALPKATMREPILLTYMYYHEYWALVATIYHVPLNSDN